jgi:hypothetical protein
MGFLQSCGKSNEGYTEFATDISKSPSGKLAVADGWKTVS